MKIQKGNDVTVTYRVEHNGEIVDESPKDQPIVYRHGDKKLLGTIQNHLEGHSVGDEVVFELAPDDAYGVYYPDAVEEVPKSEFPQFDELKVGMMLKDTDAEDDRKVARVVEVKEDSVVLDFNHPMAGKSLKYIIQILEIK